MNIKLSPFLLSSQYEDFVYCNVFIPFIFMTIITTTLLFAFGLDPKKGKYNYKVEYPNDLKQTNSKDINYLN